MNEKTMHASMIFNGASILKVNVSSTGLCGGDAGHGGRTDITFEAEAGLFQINGETVEGFTLTSLGDCEQQNLLKALKFITKNIDAVFSEGTLINVPGLVDGDL